MKLNTKKGAIMGHTQIETDAMRAMVRVAKEISDLNKTMASIAISLAEISAELKKER